MINLNVTVDFDLGAIDRKLEALEDELAQAVEVSGLRLETLAKLNAPVDTGFLRNSIQLHIGGATSVAADGTAGIEAGNPLEAEVIVGAEYGLYVEYGHYVARTRERKFDTAGRGVGYGKKTVRRAASRILDRRVGTYVQGRFYMTRAMLDVEPYFRGKVVEAIASAGRVR
ncbi:MAG: HK97 gp10 family phage protein [Fimbriimonas sp.]